MNNKGFTLIEIVLVIVILGILVSLFIPNFGKTQLASRVTAHNANVKMLKSAGAMYLLDNEIGIEKDIPTEKLKEYLDKDVNLKVDKVISESINGSGGCNDSFEIKVNRDGNIEVTPGLVELEGDKVVLFKKENKND